MRRSVTRRLWPVLLLAGAAGAQTVGARLLTPASSYRTRSGSEIKAQITTPLCAPDGTALPDGITLAGVATHVHKVGLGLIHESAGMQFDFEELRLPDGRAFPVQARLVEVSNARERVDNHGHIHGIRATSTLSNRAGQHLVLLAMGHPLALMPLFALETALVHFPEPEIDYGTGTQIQVAVDFPEALGKISACPVGQPPSPETASELRALVESIPAWSYSGRKSQDPVSLVFIGSEDRLMAAFTAAGWTGSEAHTAAARWRVVRAIAENHADPDAPMRTLLLSGAEPDLSLQKALDTFEKRDHLRIWRRDGSQWDDQTVWASAATRDIGTGFGVRPFGFTHRIEVDVDQERSRVVNDLIYTGCVDSVQYVERGPLAGYPDYRRGIQSDGRVAVVFLNSCREPRLTLTEASPGQPPPLAVRCIRRATLTARNHFLRDNIFWRSAEALRFGIDSLRAWSADHKMPAPPMAAAVQPPVAAALQAPVSPSLQ
jgi:hypothetical protein